MRFIIFALLGVRVFSTQIVCPSPSKFYVDCSTDRNMNDAIQLCTSHGMTLLNLTNSSSSSQDLLLLNNTMASNNCSGNFWFSSSNSTVAAASSTGPLDLSTIINAWFCFFGNCPTPAPVTSAKTVCTRSTQTNIRQKCSIHAPQATKSDFHAFSYIINDIYVGDLYTVTAKSLIECQRFCSLETKCAGTTFTNKTCKLYL